MTSGSSTRVAVVGAGIVGSRIVWELQHRSNLDTVIATSRPAGLATRSGLSADSDLVVVDRGVVPTVDIAVLATPARFQTDIARRYLAKGAHVVTTVDDLNATRQLLALDELARERDRSVIVGAGFVPGVSCAIAAQLAQQLEVVDELHIAKHGTAGPACARQHHRALRLPAEDWEDGSFVRRPGGSGRELVWFPAPIDGADCYRAELADQLLLARAMPDVGRVTSRVAANRRDRFTSFLPPLLPPHAEGGVGAVRVEARGTTTDGLPTTLVHGVAAQPGHAAAAMAAVAIDVLRSGAVGPGSIGVAELGDPADICAGLLASGLTLMSFVGTAER